MSSTKTGNEWHQCPANARHLGDDGRETVIVCNLDRHCDPSDSTVVHYDDALDIWWHYADGMGYDDTEVDPVLAEIGEL
jgi:hypothetical protein